MKNTIVFRALLSFPLFVLIFAFNFNASDVMVKGIIKNPLNKPVKNAEIVLDMNGYKIFVTHSNAQGVYQFKNIKPGKYILSVSFENYNAYCGVVEITENLIIEKNFTILGIENTIEEIAPPEKKVLSVGWTRN